MFRKITKTFVTAAVYLMLASASAMAADSGVDQSQCYRDAVNAANAARPVDSAAFINSVYYGCMKQRGYKIPPSASVNPAEQYASASRNAPVQSDAVAGNFNGRKLTEEDIKAFNAFGLKDPEVMPLSD